jgi:ketosteroid isomerase-like protein
VAYGLDITNRFTFHPATPATVPVYERIRAAGLEFAQLLAELCPSSPELSRAVAHVDEAVMNANAAVARHTSREG